MIPTLLGIFFLIFIALLITRAVIQYKSYEIARPTHAYADDPAAPLITVVVPARNEEQNIGRCLAGLIHQDYPRSQMRIVVVDDISTDGTAQVVARFQQLDDRIQLVRSKQLPPGWKGKPHACWQGADTWHGLSARGDDDHGQLAHATEYLCFIDADTRPLPSLLATAAHLASSRNIDMLSLEPYQELGTFFERLLIPCGFFLLAFSHDLRRVNDPNEDAAVANGQLIFINRKIYMDLGGHRTVRDQICEDSALARLVKHSGHRLAVIGAEPLIRTRMYTNLRELWQGVSKNLVEMIGSPQRTIFFGVVAVLLAISAIAFPISKSIPGIIASAALFGVHIGGAIYFGIPFWYGLLFPIGYLIGCVLCFYSVIIKWRGNISWKGRTYSPTTIDAPSL